MKHLRHLAFVGLFLAATCADAQFQIKGGTFNHLRAVGVPVDPGGSPPAVTPQFAGLATTAANSAAVPGAVPSAHYDRYPAGRIVEGVTVIQAIVLMRSSFGGAFASGVPRYSHGDEILRPVLAASGSGPVEPSYWRAMPVAYGEVITQPDGTQVTPRPNPNAPGAAPADTFYFSPHANKVFAHRPGRVSIMWVTRIPVDVDGSLEFQFKEEIFDVSSGTNSPVRKIYWTERTFNGPKVNIPTGRIVTVNPVYSTFFPQNVAQEYQAIGYVPPDPDASPPPELRTLWFENTAGLGQLRAYNHEGRVFVEYLGALTGSGGSIHEFLGADIVEVKQVAKPTPVTVKLGERILPHNSLGKVPANAGLLLPSAVLNLAQEGITYYGTSSMPDGRLIHHAEWENDNPDKVIFYWLERTDAAIHFHAPTNLEIPWPRYLNKYLQIWPQSISEYTGVTVEDHGSTTDTGVQFHGGNIPEVVFQDDGAQSEVSIDLSTQRLVVVFSQNSDKTNRKLLKFSNGSGIWYQRLFIQSHTVLGSPFMADPDGPGPLTETPAVHTLADLNADGIRDLSPAGGVSANNVLVGQRIEPPGDAYEVAGYIAAGNAYHPAAYINPFLTGMQSAAAGAIIPVNAIPGANELMIWWFKKIEPPDASFEAFHVPSKSGRYIVSYPTGADRIILASNEGSGILNPVKSAGEIYVQNDPTKPGYNPNEEHALMLAGRAYAIRDDLNITSGASYTSKPFVLVSYTDPADSRPALHVFEVLRENADFQFDYPVTAGTNVPSPMPLPLLPLPLRPDGTVPNAEVVEAAQDPAPNRSGSNTAPLRYNHFTYQDRKGYTKVYRGPHDGGAPTMGMRFYYTMRNGFFIPGLTSQPAAGTVLPYLRPLSGGVPQGDPVTGTPLTITYRPAWPDAVPELRIGETLTLPKFGLPQVRGQSSARVLYQQSVAIGGSGKPSVVLHDSTRAKAVALAAIPANIATTSYGALRGSRRGSRGHSQQP